MKLQDLEKKGLPPRVIKRWSERQGDALLPVQARAVRKGLLDDIGADNRPVPVRMLISAPTASGKSFCAEMAIGRALARRRKAVMLVPLKALAEQKYHQFKNTFGALGLHCIIATGDHPEFDHAFTTGDYDIAVAIYEKFDLLLTARLDALATIGLVVVDEIQTISEPGRGAVLERLLTKLLATDYQSSLVGLSAVVGESETAAGRLAGWLDATLVEETARPVDLLRGIAAEGTFKYRSANSGLDSDEPFACAGAGEDAFEIFSERLCNEPGSSLVFLKSRRETIESAIALASAVNWPEARPAIDQLSDDEPSFLVRTLRQVLRRGVAFHNADLSPRQRLIVEQAFADKSIKVIFATTTLAMGVDLPADTVYLETVKYTSGRYDTRPCLVPVSRAEFDNMTGRAGRLGQTECPRGKAVVLAQSEFERDVLWENYIAADTPEPIRSVFSSIPLDDWVLNMVVSGLAASEDDLAALYRRTLSAAIEKPGACPDCGAALVRLATCDLVRGDDFDGTWRPTPFGAAVALSAVRVEQAEYFLRRLGEHCPETPFGWTALALSAPNLAVPAGLLGRFEAAERLPQRLLYREYDHLIGEAEVLIGESHRREPLPFFTLAALKALLILDEWRAMTPVQEIEERFQVHLGQVMSLGETVAHLVSALARLIAARDRHSPHVRIPRELAFSLRFGLDSRLLELHRCLGDTLTRSEYLSLLRRGITSVDDFLARPSDDIEAILGDGRKLLNINEKLSVFKQEDDMQQVDVRSEQPIRGRSATLGRPSSIEIDGSYERERYVVRIDGFPVRLTGKSFKYFARLAWARVRRESGWMFKEDIEAGFNQARYLYRMKNEIHDGLPTTWGVIENNRLGYYRLSAEAASIKFNTDNLRKHPDYEVRSLVSDQQHRAAN